MTRNEARLARRRAEYQHERTIQWLQAQRTPRVRAWARDEQGGLATAVMVMLGLRKRNIARMKQAARG